MTKRGAKAPKPTKASALASVATPVDVETLSSDLLLKSKSILGTALGHLEHAIRELGEALREPGVELEVGEKRKHDREGWSHHAWLTKQVAQVAGEVRKIEAADRDMGKKLSPALVMGFFRSMDPEERMRFVRQVQALDDTGSVLG